MLTYITSCIYILYKIYTAYTVYNVQNKAPFIHLVLVFVTLIRAGQVYFQSELKTCIHGSSRGVREVCSWLCVLASSLHLLDFLPWRLLVAHSVTTASTGSRSGIHPNFPEELGPNIREGTSNRRRSIAFIHFLYLWGEKEEQTDCVIKPFWVKNEETLQNTVLAVLTWLNYWIIHCCIRLRWYGQYYKRTTLFQPAFVWLITEELASWYDHIVPHRRLKPSVHREHFQILYYIGRHSDIYGHMRGWFLNANVKDRVMICIRNNLCSEIISYPR